MQQSKHILEATGVHRQFQTAEGILQVLKGVDLAVKRGEMVAITGVSGVGKSTLLHILGGLDRPSDGQVSLDGMAFSSLTEEERAKIRNQKVGFVFQFHYLLEDFTALENVMIPMLLAGVKRTDAARQGEQLLAEVGLSGRKSHRPDQLSGGEQQRVAVARALANDPGVVLADEPSGNLDSATGRMLHDLLFRLNSEKSTTFLIATHNQELAERCTRQLHMADGRLHG